MNARLRTRAVFLVIAALVVVVGSSRIRASQTGTCGGQSTTIPFDDVLPGSVFFCAIAEAFFSGLTNGTTATTYSPSANVPREQMAAFITRTMDQSMKRGSKRAALNQYWTTQTANNLALTTVGNGPGLVQSDGADLWVPNGGSDTVSRVRASDGKLLDTWTGATNAFAALCAMGKVFVAGQNGSLYQIDPSQAGGPVTTLSSSLGPGTLGIGYDGQRIWTACVGLPGSVSIITLNPTAVTTVTTGFTSLYGVIYDGSSIWVTDNVSGTTDKLRKLDSTGAILLSVDVGNSPQWPAFDGTNIWVPNQGSNTVSVVRAIGGFAGSVIATLSGNGLNQPSQAAFDGERILVTNFTGDSVSLWKATDLTPIGTVSTGGSTFPVGACSDGVNFWISLASPGKMARF